MRSRLAVVVVVLLVAGPAFAAKLTGTVSNGTTLKPQAGAEVVLLELSQGMTEAARAQADARGRFSFEVQETGGPHMVRVNHQGVNYFKMAPPGTPTADVQIFDVAEKVEGLAAPVNIIRLQADGNTLHVTELYAVKNTSDPPRTQMSERSFEIFLPEGAQIEGSMAAGPGGQPVNSAPVPQGEKGRYAFVFPLRPGETRFQVSYHLPYSGKVDFQPRSVLPMEHLVVMTAPTMEFSPADAKKYQPMQDESGARVSVATSAGRGDGLGFTVSGTGTIPDEQQAAQGGEGGAPAGGVRQGPGGGLGRPIQTPDPLYNYRWYILGGLGVLLMAGAAYTVSRAAPAAAPVASVAAPATSVRVEPRPAAAATVAASGNRILDALKEELFQLELDRHQGRISPEEYDRARAALDTTIQRAASRPRA